MAYQYVIVQQIQIGWVFDVGITDGRIQLQLSIIGRLLGIWVSFNVFIISTFCQNIVIFRLLLLSSNLMA